MTGANNATTGPLAVHEEVNRVSSLMDELRSLLEGSMSTLGKAKGSLSGDAVFEMATAGQVEKQLKNAAEGLEKMSELVHAAMQGPSVAIGSAALSRARPVTLGECVQHAVELLTPMARSRNVELVCEFGPGLDGLAAGALYTVVLNGLQNAIESVSRRGGGGRVQVCTKRDEAPASFGYGRDARDWYVLEINDDGVGPPTGPHASRVFDLGFSTKPRGTGVGLSVAKNVVQGMGGTIELLPRLGTPGERGGAVLRVRFPNPALSGIKMGGAA
jgi:signal transduction histidine kinase